MLPVMLDEAHNPTTWCWEFWLNRYQTLVGTVVAVVAALATWIGIQRQTRSNWESTQLQLRSARVHQLREERVLVRALRLAAADLIATAAPLEFYLKRDTTAQNIAHFDLQEKFAEVERKTTIFRDRWSNVLIEDRLVNKVVDLSRGVWRLKAAFALAMLEARNVSEEIIFANKTNASQKSEWDASGKNTHERLLAAYNKLQIGYRQLMEDCETEIARLTVLISYAPDPN